MSKTFKFNKQIEEIERPRKRKGKISPISRRRADPFRHPSRRK